MTKSDYIILGAGASGLLMAYRMAQDPYFEDTSILIIDKDKNKGNDRTWCYWEEGPGEWDDILTKTWPKIFFGSASFSKTIAISPFQYKMIRSEPFYHALWSAIHKKPNIRYIQAHVTSCTELESEIEVVTTKGRYFCTKLLNSIPDSSVYQNQNKYPVLQQHFVGWFIKTKTEQFDDTVAHFMDFNIPQKGNTRFMYILPIDKKTALLEYTLFSKDLLAYTDYEDAIKTYLKEMQITDFEIIEKEQGSIPMTSFKFLQLNSKNVLNIGTAGGWTKASTGYTFKNTSNKTKALISFLKTETDLSKFSKYNKFWFYDLLFLDVLAKYNKEGAALFTSMFKIANTKTLFKFLDEDSSLLQDLRIIISVPPKRFIQALFKRLFSL